MERLYYEEMTNNVELLIREHLMQERYIFLFGHCNASEELADLLIKKGYRVEAILDNNISKQSTTYKNIPIVSPYEVLKKDMNHTLICVVSRAYEAMMKQLKQIGYTGLVKKIVDYNSYAEYSLSETTISEKLERVDRGIHLLEKMQEKYSDNYRIYCPFSALGDVYYMMAYLPHFLQKKNIQEYVIFTIGHACADVVRMFGTEKVEILSQKDMDETIQAVLYTNDLNAYIPHQDRPYVVNLAKALYVKKISLEMIYKYGVLGLDKECIPYKPVKLEKYALLNQFIRGKAVVLSPYAKSVTHISSQYWEQIIEHYRQKGYQIFTNVAGEEQALPGTARLDVKLSELQSVVEYAGTFIGLRSGLCDVIKDAKCRKIALYPDCYYSDTRWKMEEIYHLDGWENIVVS